MKSVAVIGTGAMGGRLARRLLDTGYAVHVWNRTRERTAPLLARGAVLAATPARAARAADGVITMVSNPAALRRVTEGPDGALAGLRDGAVLLEMSTVGPAAVRRLATGLPQGAALLDAPVLGSLSEAESGTLKIFAGGSRDVFAQARGLLEVLGSPILVGGQGAGATAKLMANGTLFAVLAALGEALQFADRTGLPRDAAFEVLAMTPLGQQAERRQGAIRSGVYPRRFALSLARKDADLLLDTAQDCGADLRLAAAARSWLSDAQGKGLGEADYSEVLRAILG